jgi:hypothetical protein
MTIQYFLEEQQHSSLLIRHNKNRLNKALSLLMINVLKADDDFALF